MTDTPPVDQGDAPLEFDSPILREGYAYWYAKIRDGALPRRTDIDPVEISGLMPHAVLLDVKREPEFDFRYRLIGTYVSENLYKDHTGSWFSEIDHQKAPSRIWQNCLHVVESGEAFKADTPYVGPHQGYRQVEDIILPLADDGKTVDCLLVFVHYMRRLES
tara:strand:+ start:774 stop:1259 length:486 start_codon:yes stop_codon:yes gene_type:complete